MEVRFDVMASGFDAPWLSHSICSTLRGKGPPRDSNPSARQRSWAGRGMSSRRPGLGGRRSRAGREGGGRVRGGQPRPRGGRVWGRQRQARRRQPWGTTPSGGPARIAAYRRRRRLARRESFTGGREDCSKYYSLTTRAHLSYRSRGSKVGTLAGVGGKNQSPKK